LRTRHLRPESGRSCSSGTNHDTWAGLGRASVGARIALRTRRVVSSITVFAGDRAAIASRLSLEMLAAVGPQPRPGDQRTSIFACQRADRRRRRDGRTQRFSVEFKDRRPEPAA
jgi:hypothetical protein